MDERRSSESALERSLRYAEEKRHEREAALANRDQMEDDDDDA